MHPFLIQVGLRDYVTDRKKETIDGRVFQCSGVAGSLTKPCFKRN